MFICRILLERWKLGWKRTVSDNANRFLLTSNFYKQVTFPRTSLTFLKISTLINGFALLYDAMLSSRILPSQICERGNASCFKKEKEKSNAGWVVRDVLYSWKTLEVLNLNSEIMFNITSLTPPSVCFSNLSSISIL